MYAMMKSTREAYGEALAELGEENDFYVMDADLSKATQTARFSQKYPDRFIDMGIAEGNMFGYAAGISTCGIPVFASTFAAFAAGRAYDQIRNSIAYPKCNVKIGATHAGVLIGGDGGSHQCIEDLALMRAVPNMTVLCPSDSVQAKSCVKAALQYEGPVYMRFGRLGTPDIYDGNAAFEFVIGKGYVVREGADLTIAAVGDLVAKSLKAAEILEQEGIHATVVDMASIKPIDEKLICELAVKTGCFVTAEDHNVIGGLNGAVSEVLAKNCPCPVEAVGLQDTFGRSGDPAELEIFFGIDPNAVVKAAEKVLKRKKHIFETI